MLNGFESSETAEIWSELLANDLRRFLTAKLKCPETAADLTHETYLRLNQRHSDDPPDNARALAFHIAVQLAIDYQRKVAVRNRYLVEDDSENPIENISTGQANPEQILAANQRLQVLRTALDELPTECRTVFLLHGVEGLKYSEIAERLGISVSMVGKHLARAMALCAQRLED